MISQVSVASELSKFKLSGQDMNKLRGLKEGVSEPTADKAKRWACSWACSGTCMGTCGGTCSYSCSYGGGHHYEKKGGLVVQSPGSKPQPLTLH